MSGDQWAMARAQAELTVASSVHDGSAMVRALLFSVVTNCNLSRMGRFMGGLFSSLFIT